MFSKRIFFICVPLVVAMAALTLLLATLAARADGPVVDTSAINGAITTVLGQTANARTGHAIATGDVNGDGYQDLIVGAPYADVVPGGVFSYCVNLPFNEYADCVSGGVYLYLGRPGISRTLDLATGAANVVFYASPTQYSGEELGRSIAVGDLNGDGLDDIVMGANHYGNSPIGAAFVWVGRTSVNAMTAISVDIKSQATASTNGYNLKMSGAWTEDYLGWDVTSGDVNGDGIDDLIAGAHRASADTVTSTDYFPPDFQRYHYSAADRTQNGVVYVRLGSAGLISATGRYEDPMRCLPELTIYGENSDDHLGRSLASGDVDGDGYDDIIVGADGGDPGESISNAGEVYVFFGSNAITYTICSVEPPPIAQNQIVKELAYLTTTADITITGASSGDGSGYDVGVGDLNHDGYDDIIVGAPYANGNRGRVYVVYGGPRPSLSPTIPLAQANLTVSIATTNTWLGSSVFAGDINHDGTDDLLMGGIGVDPDDADYLGTPSSTQKGTAFALFGYPTLSGTLNLSTGSPANFTIIGAAPGDWLGRGLAVGDLNGDSFNELLVGAAGLNRSPSITDVGAAYLFNFVYPQLITVTGNLTQVVAGNPVSFSASARTWLDTRDVTSQTTFALPPAASGSWYRNVYTSSRAGTWPVSGTFDALVVGTTSLSVLPGPFVTMTISPSTASALPNTIVQLQATGSDLYGNPIAGLSFAWSIVNGGAQILSSGPTTVAVRTVLTDATYPNTVLATSGSNSNTASIVVLNVPPQAHFTCGSCTSPEGSALPFNASTSSDPNLDPLSYAWSFGDGRMASGKTPSHTFSDNGSFTVTLTASDDKSLTGSYQRTVTITNVPPAPSITAITSTLISQPVTFSAAPNDPGTDTFEYRWYWGDGSNTLITATATVHHTFTSAGTFTVTLHATDDDGGAGEARHVIHVQQGHFIFLPLAIRSY